MSKHAVYSRDSGLIHASCWDRSFSNRRVHLHHANLENMDNAFMIVFSYLSHASVLEFLELNSTGACLAAARSQEYRTYSNDCSNEEELLRSR